MYSKLEDYFGDQCKVAIEGVLFFTKDSSSEIKKDLNKPRVLARGKGVELVPDFAVYCNKEQIFKRVFLGISQLIIEVLSMGNAEDDTIKKKEIYENLEP